MLDAQIFFSLLQTIVGVWGGLVLKVGQGNTWSDVENTLARKIIPHYKSKLDVCRRKAAAVQRPSASGDNGLTKPLLMNVQSDDRESLLPGKSAFRHKARMQGNAKLRAVAHCVGVPDDIKHKAGTAQVAENEDWNYHQHGSGSLSLGHFMESWNTFIDKLRHGDYISKRESDIYRCMVFPADGEACQQRWLPPLLSLGSVAQLMESINESEADFKETFFGKLQDDQDLPSSTRSNKGEEIPMHGNCITTNTEMHYEFSDWKEHANSILSSLKTGEFDECRAALAEVLDLTLFLMSKLAGPTFGATVVKWFFETCNAENAFENVFDERGGPNAGFPIVSRLFKEPTQESAAKYRAILMESVLAFADTIKDCYVKPASGKLKITISAEERCELADSLEQKGKKKVAEAKEAWQKLTTAKSDDGKQVYLNSKYDFSDWSKCRVKLIEGIKLHQQALNTVLQGARGGSKESDVNRQALHEAQSECLRVLLHQLLLHIKVVCESPGRDPLAAGSIEQAINDSNFLSSAHSLDKPEGAFEMLQKDRNCRRAATYVSHLLSTKRADAVPVSEEAQRRIVGFTSSLHMPMPAPVPVKAMKSMTTLTPYFNEQVLYTREEIMDGDNGQASIFSYLKTVHPDEWRNLCERLDMTQQVEVSGLV
jgi:hypothetical protein